jgi:uncharacterized membrane protein YeaQ/YmgE (transglycosylase-associated protein family)
MLFTILVGALTGFLAGRYLRGTSLGTLGNIGLGIAGALIARLIIGVLGFGPSHMLGDIITGFVGAMVFRYHRPDKSFFGGNGSDRSGSDRADNEPKTEAERKMKRWEKHL